MAFDALWPLCQLFFHRAAAAFLAIALRFAGVIESARALPPFNPPSRPSVTAAGFFLWTSGGGACFGISPVACWTIENAISLMSRFGGFGGLLERLGMLIPA